MLQVWCSGAVVLGRIVTYLPGETDACVASLLPCLPSCLALLPSLLPACTFMFLNFLPC